MPPPPAPSMACTLQDSCAHPCVTWPHQFQGHQPISPACVNPKDTQKYDLWFCHTHSLLPFPTHTQPHSYTGTTSHSVFLICRAIPEDRAPSGDLTAAFPALQWPCPHSPVSIPSHTPTLTPDWDPFRSPRSHLVGWLPVAGACLNLHRPGLGEVEGGRGILQRCGCSSSPGAQLWHLSRSDSDSGTSRLGPTAPLASLFLCSGAVAGSDTSLLLSLPPLACLPHASAGRAFGLGAFVFQGFFSCSGQAGG